MTETPGSLCARCCHRADSRRRVAEFVALCRRGFVTDIAPLAECKRHEGYGHAPETRATCSDFMEPEQGGDRHHAVGARVTRLLYLDDGTWARAGDACLPGPLRHGVVLSVGPPGELGLPLHVVQWDDGAIGGGYFWSGLDSEQGGDHGDR